MDYKHGDRVMVNLGLGTWQPGTVEDTDDDTVGVILDDSDGSIWRTTEGHLDRLDESEDEDEDEDSTLDADAETLNAIGAIAVYDGTTLHAVQQILDGADPRVAALAPEVKLALLKKLVEERQAGRAKLQETAELTTLLFG